MRTIEGFLCAPDGNYCDFLTVQITTVRLRRSAFRLEEISYLVFNKDSGFLLATGITLYAVGQPAPYLVRIRDILTCSLGGYDWRWSFKLLIHKEMVLQHRLARME